MARIRYIKPEAFDDPDLNALPALHRWLFAGLWTQADKRGRMPDEPRRLKVRILAYDDVDVDAMLTDLATAGLVCRYEAGGLAYIQIGGFERHQRPHPKEAESLIPPPPDGAVKKHGKPLNSGPSRTGMGMGMGIGTGTGTGTEHGKPCANPRHARFAFCGKRLHVSRGLHEWLDNALGVKSSDVDLLARYPEWDREAAESGEPITDMLVWIKARVFSGVDMDIRTNPELGRKVAEMRRYQDAQKAARK